MAGERLPWRTSKQLGTLQNIVECPQPHSTNNRWRKWDCQGVCVCVCVRKASLENPRCEKHYACNNAEFNPVVIDAQFMIAAIILRDTYQCPECNAHTIMIAARMVRDNTASMIRRPMPQSQYRVSDKATDASITIQHQTNNKHGHVCASTHVHCSWAFDSMG